MPRFLPTAALLAALLAAAAATAGAARETSSTASSAPGDALFVLSGRGYGHGVGMSQYGALGMAKAGKTHEEILAYYYTGIEIETGEPKVVRVLLAEGKRALSIASTVPFSAVDGLGVAHSVPAGGLLLRPKLTLRDETGAEIPVPGPLLVRPGKGMPLTLDGKPYRGQYEVTVSKGFLRVVNHIPLETYLLGVVPGEMPDSWPAEALEAQAVAARSYALANLVAGKPFDLYSDQRSQVYRGAAAERPTTTAAVRATRRKIVTYDGKVASTLYSSSSGGRTASAADVFGVEIPYLVSRPDPWDKESPYHRWGPILIGGRALQSAFTLQAPATDATGVSTPSGRVRSVSITTGAAVTRVPGALLRTALGLRSTWVTIGVLRVDRPRSQVVYGDALRLSGIARSVGSVSLARSNDGDVWRANPPFAAAADGTFSFVLQPDRTERYRLQSKSANSPAILVAVTPKVRLVPPTEPGTLTGTVRPLLEGTTVTVERLDGARWSAVGSAIVAADGSFTVLFEPTSGSFRARVPATDGYSAGVSPVLDVSV